MRQEHWCVEGKRERRLYKIGMFAQMNHVTVKTLRYYEEQKLLLPAQTDSESGYRYYTMDQMSVLHRITALKQAGFTIEDIKGFNSTADAGIFLKRKRAELLAKIAELTRQVAVLDGYMTEGSDALEAPVLVKMLPAVTVAVMQTRVEGYDAFFDLMPQMGAEMERLGCECALPEYCFTCYLEAGYQSENLLIETCEAVTEQKEGSALLQFKELPETQAACVYHKGSYNLLPQSYAAAIRYIEEHGYEICGNIRESYIDGVWNAESEDSWLTEIQIPVQKRNAS